MIATAPMLLAMEPEVCFEMSQPLEVSHGTAAIFEDSKGAEVLRGVMSEILGQR